MVDYKRNIKILFILFVPVPVVIDVKQNRLIQFSQNRLKKKTFFLCNLAIFRFLGVDRCTYRKPSSKFG